MNNLFNPQFLLELVISLPVIIISLCFHETAHAFVAYKLGDPTAKNLGRVSMNPLKHLDIIGTICMIFFKFGWAKPVPINARYFRNPKRDMALSAVAGPISNLILCFIGLILFAISQEIYYTAKDASAMFIITTFFYLFYYLNLHLALFNLIPVPPLDGSRLAFIFLPDKLYWGVMKYERIIMLVMMVALYLGFITGPLNFVSNAIMNGLEHILGLLPFFPHL